LFAIDGYEKKSAGEASRFRRQINLILNQGSSGGWREKRTEKPERDSIAPSGLRAAEY
jgi:hypothetical protein